jgi:hypothetical protein
MRKERAVNARINIRRVLHAYVTIAQIDVCSKALEKRMDWYDRSMVD